MQLTDICISLENAKKLCELGVKQQSLFYWGETLNDKNESQFNLYINDKPACNILAEYCAFTCQELGMMFPTGFTYLKATHSSSFIYLYEVAGTRFYNNDENESNLRARAIIRMIEEKEITAEEVNRRIA